MSIMFAFCLPAGRAPAVFAQGIKLHLITKSKYFSVYSYKGLDISLLLTKLNFNYFRQLDNLSYRSDMPRDILASTLDALYLEVSDILDIHMYSFHGNIDIVPDKGYVSSIFRSYFKRNFPERSFYFHNKNTIYISFADLTLGILGHEIGHAIISHYFVVLPPAKIQEVLCGYIEYSLGKSTGTIPK